MGKPTKTAADYSPAMVEEFARQFRPQARRYRWQSNLGSYGFIGCVIGTLLLARTWSFVFPIGMALAVLFLIFFALRSDILPPCPACHGDLDPDFGRFCPECGSVLIWEDLPGGWRVCRSCRHPLRHGKGRNYRIRNCTHCGLRLDEKGL